MDKKPKYSFIVPLYNRPDEIDELLDTMTRLTYTDFEVVVVEDGSVDEKKSEEIVDGYRDRLDIQYFCKPNSGPGLTRNYGMERARGEWFIILDSDIIMPPDYFDHVESFLQAHPDVDCYGGPDAAHESFDDLNKAISYSMTSFLTTGGIRGRKKQAAGQYHPRSFNMGLKREVFEATQGFAFTRQGEDIDFSIRILDKGFKIALIPDAVVFHKRRATFRKFYRQVFNFGQARWGLYKMYPKTLKLAHLFPSVFVLYLLSIPLVVGLSVGWQLPWFFPVVWALPAISFTVLNLVFATTRYRSLIIGLKSLFTSYIQLVGYGLGFMRYMIQREIFGNSEYKL